MSGEWRGVVAVIVILAVKKSANTLQSVVVAVVGQSFDVCIGTRSAEVALRDRCAEAKQEQEREPEQRTSNSREMMRI